VFQERLASSFGGADEVLLADVFRAADIAESERLNPEALVRTLHRSDRPAHFLPKADQILAHLERHASAGDIVLIMSNGGFDGLHTRLLEALERRVEA